jgi:hypothetical protein
MTFCKKLVASSIGVLLGLFALSVSTMAASAWVSSENGQRDEGISQCEKKDLQLTDVEKIQYREFESLTESDRERIGSLDNQGGPDSFQYSYHDNVAPDSVSYDWIELRGDPGATWIGGYADFTHIDDGYSRHKLSIGFPFPFYGVEYDCVRVGTDGFFQFTTFSTSWMNGCFPFGPIPGPTIAVFWDDLSLVTGGQADTLCIGYKNFGDYFIIEYDGVGYFELLCRGVPLKFEVILCRSGDIKLQYHTITHANCRNSQSIGIQQTGEQGSPALNYVCNSTGVQPTDRLAILFARANGIPAKVANLSGTFDGTDVLLTWTDPTQDTRGNPVAITAVEIWNGPVSTGQLLATVNPGVQTYTHAAPANGVQIYNVRAYASPYYADTNTVSVIVGTVSIVQDFEADNGGWIATPASGGWEWGPPTYTLGPLPHSGANVWGTRLASAYSANACWQLDLAPNRAVISSEAYVELYYWCFVHAPYDGCNFKISVDDGLNWTIVTPENGYVVSSLNAGNACIAGQSAWSEINLNRAWSYVRLPIGDYLGQIPMFRFEFGSDATYNYVGFYFDDLLIWGLGVPNQIYRDNPYPALPTELALHQNFPNPFNSTTEIRLSLPRAMHVELCIFNVLGRTEGVRLMDAVLPAGTHRVQWDGTDVGGNAAASGLYICRLQAGSLMQSRKMILLR